MFRRVLLVGAALLLNIGLSQAQTTYETDNVQLFQTFYQDTPIAELPYGEGFFQYSAFDGNVSSIDLSVQGGLPVSSDIQVAGGLGFRSLDIPGGSQSGITDLTVSGRYQVLPGLTAISVGALATLPIGSKDIGENTFDFNIFGSLRHHLPSRLVITGTLALESDEVKTIKSVNPLTGSVTTGSDRNTAFLLAGGIIYPLPSGVNVVGELDIRTKGQYVLLTGGLDYKLKTGGRIRGGIGIGLDDGAPNFVIRGGYFLAF
jgi:Putative MetA-pathway of phenol degradation